MSAYIEFYNLESIPLQADERRMSSDAVFSVFRHSLLVIWTHRFGCLGKSPGEDVFLNATFHRRASTLRAKSSASGTKGFK